MILRNLSACLLLLSMTPARAEFVELPGPVSLTQFYDAVSCGAPPGGACQIAHRRWPPGKAQTLTVRVMQVQAGVPMELARLLQDAVPQAIAEINRVAPITLGLRHDPMTPDPDIAVYIIAKTTDNHVTGTGLPHLDGLSVANARVIVRSQNSRIRKAWVLLSQSVTSQTALSVTLEELVQSLGFLFDVRGPAHAGRSIFDEDGSAVTRLDGQDAAVLSVKYPY